MIGIVIVTHGDLCIKLVETAELLGIKSKNIETVTFSRHEGLDDLHAKITRAIEKVDKGEGILLLTDLLHGSCSKVAGEFLEQKGIEVICGVNLPMIISIITHQGEELHYVLQKAKDSSIKNIVDLKEMLKGR